MNRILYTNENGTLSIIIPVDESLSIEEIVAKDVPSGTAYEVVDVSSIPIDRTFRNAWEHDSVKKVKVNMGKAKEIAHEKRRKQRDELFKPLDIQSTIPSQAQQAEVARQAIRDADAQKQIGIDNATSTEELKAILGL